MTKLIPPINFGMVEDDLYRSGFPNELNFPFLEKLALKTIISLGPEDLPQKCTLIGCLRKIQRWNLATIFEEYRRFAGSKVRLNNEQFIELFDTDLVQIPEEPPSWL
ncbi:tyrosine-protein phosphatase oca1-related [Anaeramoeba ignava]|uniref:protein-tyrosine-phosphatase n=1 Tax=Anaeramoeba ignava TaxID=1746090 RepID=A0A9Q0LGK2_ANAIG|nr:tyrosine-protein phosphatase oca1-related [Anaeramoeba ignava]